MSIESIDYPKWVSNMVHVNRANGNLCIYTNFHDLNQACPKDEFSLLNIDILVDNTMGYEILSLIDGFSSYNQIWVNLDDEHKIAFTILYGTYYYKVMPFDLKNTNATYQHAMTYIFYDMMHNIVEDYIDNLLTKSPT